MKLKTALKFNEKVMPACLPEPSFLPEEKEGFGVVSGWGTTSEGNYKNSQVQILPSAIIFSFLLKL